MKLDPFYLIVDSCAWIERLVPLGVKLVQLRIKDKDEFSLRQQICSSMAICERHGCQLIVNDYWRIAIEEGCDFVHLGQEDLARADVKAIRRAGIRLGLSTHDDTELKTALAAEPDYVALGPIYPTTLKAMKWAPQGLDRIAVWKQRVGDLPLVAIGGLTIERANSVFAQGAESAAVVTDIVRNARPEVRVLKWLAATAQWR
ncbi:thiamine phosphate synthase [Mesorhizobium delmotii]|uniref:Thiamine-phosphate synthase n=1 Tax=Mesorhizobium delmotii TaxID=1631247 RepID=A0A2P9AGC6_9HYPH|nr:thiamine phosphate synthase [Mesorhizobium delmotii]SJM30195.1 thiamin phosphate synthase (thiamin phosphate pyrophosphorylase) [Mesorhizobium delmotii]